MLCDLRTGHICSDDQFGFPQKWQLRFETFLFSLKGGFRFRVWLMCPICSSPDELLVESLVGFLFPGFLSPYFRLQLSSSMVSSTNWISSGPFMNLSRAFLSLMVAAKLYNLFQYSSNVSLSSCFIVKNCALLWNTFLTGNVFLNYVNKSCRVTSSNSRPH